jgi:hypothetical protein
MDSGYYFRRMESTSLRFDFNKLITILTTTETLKPSRIDLSVGVTECKPDGEVAYKRQWPDVPMPRLDLRRDSPPCYLLHFALH